MVQTTTANTQSARRAQVRGWGKLAKQLGLQPGDALPKKKDRKKKYPPLTDAQRKLVEDHMWIAGRLAHSARAMTGGFTGCFTRDDLESVAFFALCVAATRYDKSLGWEFSTFAWNTARGYIQHALRDHSRMVRIPRWIVPVREDVKRMLQEGATYEEICEELGLTEQQVLMCEQSWQEIHSSYDHTPDEWRPREFIYEMDEARVLIGKDVVIALGDLPDSDLNLLLSHVEGSLEDPSELKRAEELLEFLRSLIKKDG